MTSPDHATQFYYDSSLPISVLNHAFSSRSVVQTERHVQTIHQTIQQNCTMPGTKGILLRVQFIHHHANWKEAGGRPLKCPSSVLPALDDPQVSWTPPNVQIYHYTPQCNMYTLKGWLQMHGKWTLSGHLVWASFVKTEAATCIWLKWHALIT